MPERYVVHEAYLETEDGERIVDFKDNPLHIVSYSLPVDKVLSFEELQPHLYFNEKRPHSVPWVFKYYERDWGFCLPKNTFDKLPRDKKYHAVINCEFITDPKQGFKVATAVVHPKADQAPEAGEFLVQAHTCHPMQANDDGAGVVSSHRVGAATCGESASRWFDERPLLVWTRDHRHHRLACAQRVAYPKSARRHLHGDDGQ